MYHQAEARKAARASAATAMKAFGTEGPSLPEIDVEGVSVGKVVPTRSTTLTPVVEGVPGCRAGPVELLKLDFPTT